MTKYTNEYPMNKPPASFLPPWKEYVKSAQNITSVQSTVCNENNMSMSL